MSEPLSIACIDLSAIRQNVTALKAKTAPGTRFMAVVKADGYGHGARQTARAAIAAGADWLGVARIEEAELLRQAGLSIPILAFGYISPADAKRALDLDITVTTYHLRMAQALSKATARNGKRLKIHIKVDTGMGRVGMIAWDNPECIKQIYDIHQLPGLDTSGLYTHFAAADTPENPYTALQIKRFSSLIRALQKQGIDPGICHAANSAGIIGFPDAHLDMVRAGIAMYGCYPANQKTEHSIILMPAMSIKSRIVMIKTVPKNFSVSYGMTYKTKTSTRIAAVPIGYADGFSRSFSSNGHMLVKGKKAPIIGRVCMDQTMVDIGKIPEAATGDEVIILGRQGKQCLSSEMLARQIGTINYEIVSSLTGRIKRTYVNTPYGEASVSG